MTDETISGATLFEAAPKRQTLVLSDEQNSVFDTVAGAVFENDFKGVYAIAGKAGSGKTVLLTQFYERALADGLDIILPDYEGKRKKNTRSLAILAPTNKAASVLRARGVPATTLHRILYKPVYHPEYEKIADWLADPSKPLQSDKLDETALNRAKEFYETHKSIPGALAIAGVRGSDFITGWERRDDELDIAFVDEASMLDERQFADLKKIFPTLVLFGDPAQLAPVGQSNKLVFENVDEIHSFHLARIHRQAADNPILDLAHALLDESIEYSDFHNLVVERAHMDDRVQISGAVKTDLMAVSPVLVWRNATRKRLIQGFRNAYSIPKDALMEGEPLICDGIELPLKHRNKRIDLETRGLIKGAQTVYLGPGRKTGFARLYVIGTEDPYLSAASIIQIEFPDEEEPEIITAAQMGALFLHGAAITIHKSQGSQWPDVQVFAPDIRAAAYAGRVEAGIALWKRLAYVALTRAEERLHWVTDYRLTKPKAPLDSHEIRQIIETNLAPKETPNLLRQNSGDNSNDN